MKPDFICNCIDTFAQGFFLLLRWVFGYLVLTVGELLWRLSFGEWHRKTHAGFGGIWGQRITGRYPEAAMSHRRRCSTLARSPAVKPGKAVPIKGILVCFG